MVDRSMNREKTGDRGGVDAPNLRAGIPVELFRGENVAIPALTSPEETDDEVVECKELEGEGDVAEVAEDRHLENMAEADVGHPVDPFRIRIEVPQFPEKAADEASPGQGDDRTPVPARRVVEEGAAADACVDRFEDKEDGEPDEGEEAVGLPEEERQHRPSRGEEDSEGAACRGDALPTLQPPHRGERRYELGRAEYGGHHGGKIDRCMDEVIEVREVFPAVVEPVLGSPVDQLEEPPGRRREEKEAQEFQAAPREERRAGSPEDQAVHRDGISRPEREEEDMGPEAGQGPVCDPGRCNERQAYPQPDRTKDW